MWLHAGHTDFLFLLFINVFVVERHRWKYKQLQQYYLESETKIRILYVMSIETKRTSYIFTLRKIVPKLLK